MAKRKFTKYPSSQKKAPVDTHYFANMCNIAATEEPDMGGSTNYPYYIDKNGVYADFCEGDCGALSSYQLRNIYDTLVSDGDVVACSFNTFEDWLQANVTGGLLSGCWMSDAQSYDIPQEYSGYDDDYAEEYEEDAYGLGGLMSDDQLNDIPREFRDL